MVKRFVLVIAISGVACAQAKVVSDAQVEANVLKGLAGASELASEAIATKTVYGVVTLSGTVRDEKLRVQAENIAANANGVKKVIDELTLGASPAGPAPTALDQTASLPQGPAPIQRADAQPHRNNPDADQALDQQAEDRQAQQQANSIPPNPTPEFSRRPITRRSSPPYGYPAPPSYAAPMDGSQLAGQTVTVPSGTLLRVRVNERLSSARSHPDTVFDGIVVNDVVAGGAIAIPRGATVQGKVLDARSSGVLKGRGEMTLQLTHVILAGKSYPIVSDEWNHHGGDKTLETVNKTAGFGALGALFGAAAGGGVGAAVGGGIGAAAGLGSSAASGNGQVEIPSEAVLTFHLTDPATVQTVSEAEMQRLAYGVPAGGGAQRSASRRTYPEPYYGPYVPGYGYPYRNYSPYGVTW